MSKILVISIFSFLVSSCVIPNGDTKNTMKPIHDSLHVEKSQIEHAITERLNDTILLSTYTELDPVFDSLNYHLEEVRETDTVPRIFLKDIKKSLGQENSNVRKYDFLRVILSNSLLVNEQILKDRHFVFKVQNQENLSREDSLQLSMLKFRLKFYDYSLSIFTGLIFFACNQRQLYIASEEYLTMFSITLFTIPAQR